MLYDNGRGVSVFLYDCDEDAPCASDHWYESLEEAIAMCSEHYGIDASEWQLIPDPLPGCQHDWIQPTRIKCDAKGNKLWGQFEPVSDRGDGAL